MERQTSSVVQRNGLQPYLSPLAVWALSVGSAVGWGSLVVTSGTYLSQAGPLGSILGLFLGFFLMLMVANHYHVLANRYPGTGGMYNYVKFVFGYDRAFLVAWVLFLVYIALFWANATSIPLFARYFLKGMFQVGYLYTLFGYEVYLGEAIATVVAICLVALLCAVSKKATAHSMEVLVLIFTAGITVCVAIACFRHHASGMTYSPAFIPGVSALRQVSHIAFISPWAFIGFESVSHSAAEYRFKHRNMFSVLVISLVVITALYIFAILLSASAYPQGCESWLSYIAHLDEFEGIEGLPAFYAAYYYMGDFGIYIMMASLLALVLTSLIGMLRSLSRLCYAVALDGILPGRFARLSEKQIPVNAILLVTLLSLPVPFLGRTAIGWTVDTSIIGATIIYGFASAAVYKMARQEKQRKNLFLSSICLVIMVIFLAVQMFPNLFSEHAIGTETYALMTFWSLIGLLYFNAVIRKDHARNFGKAIIVWMALLAFIVLMVMNWTGLSSESRNNEIIDDIYSYMEGGPASSMDQQAFMEEQRDRLQASDNLNRLLITGLFGVSLGVLLVNYLSQQKWEKKAVEERDRATTVAFTDSMTGVKSKHAFLLSEKDYDLSIKENRAEEFAIVVCDVNGLKKVNDLFGHKAGDEYIMKASQMIVDIFQHSPVYRTGGDEFVLILSGRDYLLRKELMLALHDLSASHISTEEVVISGGLSDFEPGKDTCFHDVFDRADSLMYEEKKLLKGMGAATREDFEAAIRPAFASDENADIMRLKRHILIVEDEPVNQLLLGSLFAEGYEVLYAADGVEALEQIGDHKDDIAIVLLDLQMPRLGGMEVLKVMKEEKELKDIPVIVMTVEKSAEAECIKNGAMDFIPKPYPTAEVVKARVHRCIELSEKRGIIESIERDSQTNLFNFDYFLRYVRMYDQHYSDLPMDAIVLKVGNFHVLKERYGKEYAGDVLSSIGARWRQISREVGGVGCLRGEDAFLIYCPHREDYGAILHKVAEELEGKNGVGLRMGVYAGVDKALAIEQRFDYAKAAADTAKSAGKEAIGIYS